MPPRKRPVAIDLTPRLMNRTAVYDLAGELYDLLPPRAKARYWRFWFGKKIEFPTKSRAADIAFLAHALSSRDFDRAWTGDWARPAGHRMLFTDPVFCARTRIESDDLILCHDMGPIEKPEYYNPSAGESYDRAYRRIQAAAPEMVFVSDLTRAKFLQRYPGAYRSVQVIAPYSMVAGAPPALSAAPRERLILMVGTLERRKNHPRAVAAFQRSKLAQKGYRLIIVGVPSDTAEETNRLAAGDDAISNLGFVTREALAELYRRSEMLLFPSLLEGFGVPAIEAPRMGVLPIVSAGTVLPEIVGPKGVCVDPQSVEDIAEGLLRAAAMTSAERAAAITAIQSYQARFSIDAFRDRWRDLLYG